MSKRVAFIPLISHKPYCGSLVKDISNVKFQFKY